MFCQNIVGCSPYCIFIILKRNFRYSITPESFPLLFDITELKYVPGKSEKHCLCVYVLFMTDLCQCLLLIYLRFLSLTVLIDFYSYSINVCTERQKVLSKNRKIILLRYYTLQWECSAHNTQYFPPPLYAEKTSSAAPAIAEKITHGTRFSYMWQEGEPRRMWRSFCDVWKYGMIWPTTICQNITETITILIH